MVLKVVMVLAISHEEQFGQHWKLLMSDCRYLFNSMLDKMLSSYATKLL